MVKKGQAQLYLQWWEFYRTSSCKLLPGCWESLWSEGWAETLKIRTKPSGCTPHGIPLIFICCSLFQNVLSRGVAKQEERTILKCSFVQYPLVGKCEVVIVFYTSPHPPTTPPPPPPLGDFFDVLVLNLPSFSPSSPQKTPGPTGLKMPCRVDVTRCRLWCAQEVMYLS